jgi:anti-anti-sigma factor
VPLYACDRCGFTSTAFRPAAASAHHLEYPDCEGIIRIIFRSDDRYRSLIRTPPSVTAERAAQRSTKGRSPSREPERPLAISEHVEADHTLRLTLLGDLDLAGADRLSARLAELKAAGGPVRIDLSKLNFVDSSGVQALLLAVTDARWSGWQLEVAPQVSPSVERAAQIVGIAQVLWPQDDDPAHATILPIRRGQTTQR